MVQVFFTQASSLKSSLCFPLSVARWVVQAQMALCAISGVVPQEPVVSVKSGHVFEKRLVEKHIEMTGKCPITNEDLALTSLIPLQVRLHCSVYRFFGACITPASPPLCVQVPKVVKPRPPTATSIPGIIQIMQVCRCTPASDRVAARAVLICCVPAFAFA